MRSTNRGFKVMQNVAIVTIVAVVMGFAMVSCDTGDNDQFNIESFPGKIVIITNKIDQDEEAFRSAQQVVTKYGSNEIAHITWPTNFMAEQNQMINNFAKIAANNNVKAIIINQALPGTNAAVDKLLETRDDIFIVYCSPQEHPLDVSDRANLIMMPNEIAMGEPMVQQAKDMGAEVFVHYSFPRHMSQDMLSTRRDRISAECTRLGITFVNIENAPDPANNSTGGINATQQFILKDVSDKIDEHGEDTAFFGTNCAMQIPLIKAVSDGGAIYPQPCCPSPFHGFPTALGISAEVNNIKGTIEQTRNVLNGKNMLGRLSTWPVPASMLWTNAGVEYALRWINDEVSKPGIDDAVLAECMSDYIKDISGEDLGVNMTNCSDAFGTYDNYKLVLEDYLTY